MNGEEMLVTLSEVESRAKSNSHRIDRLERDAEALRRLAISVEVLAGEQKRLIEKIGSVDKKVGDLERLPKERWNSLVGYVISSACACIVSALVTRLLAG